MSRPLRILMSAGEASGDRLAAGLARALRLRRPDADLFGMGGEEMASAGVRILQPAAEVSVVGIAEVATRLPAIRRAMTRLERAIRAERPDLVVPVDFPDFNLRLAARARRSGIPVVYFVSPSIWAWRRGRLGAIRRTVSRMLVLYPFESRLYEEAGVPVTFVGHPAVEAAVSESPAGDALERAGLEPGVEVVALLPGSRAGEVSRLFPPMLAAAAILRLRRRHLHFLVPRAATLPEGILEAEVERSRLDGVHVHGGDYPAVLRECVAGVVASGTATLEAALAGLPIVVVYKLQPLTFGLVRLLVHVDHIALPNLVLGRRVFPELVQAECTAERIASEVERILDRPDEAAGMRNALAGLPALLGGAGAFERAAAAVLAEAAAPPQDDGAISGVKPGPS